MIGKKAHTLFAVSGVLLRVMLLGALSFVPLSCSNAGRKAADKGEKVPCWYDSSVPIGQVQDEVTYYVRPPYLKRGDTVAVFSISCHADSVDILHSVDVLRSWGLEVVFASNLFSPHGIYDGTLEERISATQALLDNPNVRMMLAIRGGYGAIQVVPRLDFSSFFRNPKWIVGYSDACVLHTYLSNKGVESIHGPMALTFRSREAENSLHDALFGNPQPVSVKTTSRCRVGEATGRLVGGNLSVLCSLQGTVLDINTKGAILFLEDVDEEYYEVDGMLENLRLSGKLDNIRGIIVGQFSSNEKSIDEQQKYDVLEEKIGSLGIPVMCGVPAGHDQPNLSLILGGKIHMKVGEEVASFEYLD